METDTIAAIATALGESGVGIVRVSGPEAVDLVARLARTRPPLTDVPTHTVHHAWLHDREGRVLDETLVSVMRAPRTYTGEDLVEIGVHGGTIPARRVLRALLEVGARLADRGEFTKRAFLCGRIDLSQAEAVADLVAARTERGGNVALAALAGKLARRTEQVEARLLDLLARLELNLDFQEDVEAVDRETIGRTLEECRERIDDLRRRIPWGRRLREGAAVVILGRPNVGKSSLFNALLEEERALVSRSPGTTRDYLEAWIDVGGMPVRLVDTAGLHETGEELEAEGVRRAERLEERADLRLVLHDVTAGWEDEDLRILGRTAGRPRVLIGNKIDLAMEGADEPEGRKKPRNEPELRVSALTGEGVGSVRERIAEVLLEGVGREPADEIVPGERHEDVIRRTVEALERAGMAWKNGESEELLAGDVRDAAEALGEITGRTVGEEVLDRIFSRFCIGK
jgi:tRNA modification GTPase